MKKIGIDARFYSSNFTGIGRYTAELIQHLAELDQENQYVIFLNDPQYNYFKVPNERFKKVRVNARHYSLSEQTKFLRAIQKEKLDLMHFTHFNAPLFYTGKTVVTIHDLILEFFPGKKMTSLFYRWGYKATIKRAVNHADHIFTVSEHTAKDLQEIMGTDRNKITVTHNGLGGEFHPTTDENLMKRVSEEYKLDRPFLLYTGVWRTHKNLVRLIEAFAKLRNEMGDDVLLVLTGKPDPIYDEVPATIEKLGLAKYVRRVGLVSEEDLIALYGMANAYVFPSMYEGFGMPPLEAMACGTPVVTSNTSSMPEVCGESALYFDPYDVDEMANQIHEVLHNKKLREKLVEGGLERIKQFSWDECTKKTLQAYRRILNEK